MENLLFSMEKELNLLKTGIGWREREREREREGFEMEAAAALASSGLSNPSKTLIKPSYSKLSHFSKATTFHQTPQTTSFFSSSSNSIFRSLSIAFSPTALRNPVPISSPHPFGRAFVSNEGETASNSPPDAIVLSVEGMICGGCTASVKRILESQPQVSSASVSLETASAVVLPMPEVKVTENWQQHLGETLANHLSNCGFKSSLQG